MGNPHGKLKRNEEGEVDVVWIWKRGPVTFLEISELNWLLWEIGSVRLCETVDKWMWEGDKNGEFSVGSVRSMLRRGIDHSSTYVMKWCNWVPAKCNVFAWRAELGKILTGVALRNMNIQVEDITCQLCESRDEINEHLFVFYSFTCLIWQRVAAWCRVPALNVASVRDLLEIRNQIGLNDLAKEVFYGIVMIACWSIWRARNELIFSNKPAKVEDIFSVGSVRDPNKSFGRALIRFRGGN
ncbi:uncharacterized protein LOC110870354 [Helianthus annuus]|uniref:uncharacterized protein LOC110870354 n=1 Tax=Helianthus annuus TaxID=4232 RepID=UPI000B908277|nr:uncharacterized protein LOC110870354 [Helianthus annuus]